MRAPVYLLTEYLLCTGCGYNSEQDREGPQPHKAYLSMEKVKDNGVVVRNVI